MKTMPCCEEEDTTSCSGAGRVQLAWLPRLETHMTEDGFIINSSVFIQKRNLNQIIPFFLFGYEECRLSGLESGNNNFTIIFYNPLQG